jgi:hypothetical protein
MTKPTEPTDLEVSAKHIEFLLDSMGRAFAVDLAVAELERRLDALEQAEPRLSQSVAETCKLGAK